MNYNCFRFSSCNILLTCFQFIVAMIPVFSEPNYGFITLVISFSPFTVLYCISSSCNIKPSSKSLLNSCLVQLSLFLIVSVTQFPVFKYFVCFLSLLNYFRDAVSKCSCNTVSPLSTRKYSKAWKFPFKLSFEGSSSREPLNAMLLRPQNNTVLKKDAMIVRFFEICCCSIFEVV